MTAALRSPVRLSATARQASWSGSSLVLADRQRIKILNLLASADEDAVCVCELVPALGLKQPTVSYHLKQLAQAGLVERERRGTFAYYRLVPGALERIGAVLR